MKKRYQIQVSVLCIVMMQPYSNIACLGCRLQKYWFHVNSRNNQKLLLTMVTSNSLSLLQLYPFILLQLPVSKKCSLDLNSDTINTLNQFFEKYTQVCKIFHAIACSSNTFSFQDEQPPYVHLVHKISYIPSLKPGGSGYAIIIQDWHPKGSLRDTLENLVCADSFACSNAYTTEVRTCSLLGNFFKSVCIWIEIAIIFYSWKYIPYTHSLGF